MNEAAPTAAVHSCALLITPTQLQKFFGVREGGGWGREAVYITTTYKTTH